MSAANNEVSVKLLTPHTHAGQSYPKDATIKVPARLLGWLEDNGVIAARAKHGDGATKNGKE